jgi:hypothetical protein
MQERLDSPVNPNALRRHHHLAVLACVVFVAAIFNHPSENDLRQTGPVLSGPVLSGPVLPGTHRLRDSEVLVPAPGDVSRTLARLAMSYLRGDAPADATPVRRTVAPQQMPAGQTRAQPPAGQIQAGTPADPAALARSAIGFPNEWRRSTPAEGFVDRATEPAGTGRSFVTGPSFATSEPEAVR